MDEDEVVDCKIEFRFLDKDRKFSEPSGPTTIVQRQVRMSREELNQVVPAPPAFSGLENDQEEFISQPLAVLDIPNPVTESAHSSPGIVPDERSIYFDAQGGHDTSTRNINRREDFSSQSRHPSKIDYVLSKTDESFETAAREEQSDPRKEDVKLKQKHLNNLRGSAAELVKFKENDIYDSVAMPEPSQYESAFQDITREDMENAQQSEGRKSVHCLLEDIYDESDKRKPSVIHVQDLTSAFQMQQSLNKSRGLTSSLSPKSTPPNSERRSLSSRQRRSCENLLESSEMSSRSSTTTPRPTDLRTRTSTSPEVLIQQRFRKSPMPLDDISPRSRIPVATRSRNGKGGDTPDEQELLYTSTPNIATANNRGARYENVERKLPLGIVDIAMSPQGNDDDSLSTRSLLSDRKNSRTSRIQSLGRETEQEDDGSFYQRTISQEDMAKDFADLTPALRRRRGVEKYVTDESQLNLRFQRRRTRPMSDVNPPPQALLNARPRQERFVLCYILMEFDKYKIFFSEHNIKKKYYKLFDMTNRFLIYKARHFFLNDKMRSH